MHQTPRPLNRVVTQAFKTAGIPMSAAAKPLGVHAKTARNRYTSGTLTANDLHVAADLLNTTASALQAKAEGER